MKPTLAETAQTAGEAPITILLVDDHDIFRSGLRELLDDAAGLSVVGEARRGEEAVQQAAAQRPDVVVMDVNMPGMTGIEAAGRIVAARPDAAVLMLTVSDADETVLDAVLAGAAGYLLKDATLDEIIGAVRHAAAGRCLIAPSVAGALLQRLRDNAAAAPAPSVSEPLTDRESEVLALIVRGSGNAEIAGALHLSVSTVKSHVAAVLEKLGAENRVQAAVIAVQNGLAQMPAARG